MYSLESLPLEIRNLFFGLINTYLPDKDFAKLRKLHPRTLSKYKKKYNYNAFYDYIFNISTIKRKVRLLYNNHLKTGYMKYLIEIDNIKKQQKKSFSSLGLDYNQTHYIQFQFRKRKT